MSGQTFRENVEQEVHYVVYKADGDTDDLIRDLVDWATERFCPVCERGKTDCPDHPFT